MLKDASYWDSLFGFGSYASVRAMLAQAVADDRVASILLRIDSPGGQCRGVDDLAQDVAKADEKKPVFAYVEDLCASAAYYVAAGARAIYANRTAQVGSIGTYGLVVDDSKFWEAAGIKFHLLTTGEFKGAGETGQPITDAQLAEFQKEVDGYSDFFVKAVSDGRDMTAKQVKDVADGRIWFAAEAKTMGLIDGVKTLDEVLGSLLEKANRGAQNRARASIEIEKAR